MFSEPYDIQALTYVPDDPSRTEKLKIVPPLTVAGKKSITPAGYLPLEKNEISLVE
jgi:hypothetical protein